eukprot:14426873-Alexandrium_andersonii.AAC.1
MRACPDALCAVMRCPEASLRSGCASMRTSANAPELSQQPACSASSGCAPMRACADALCAALR